MLTMLTDLNDFFFFFSNKAEKKQLRTYAVLRDVDGLETSVLGLHFVVQARHFREGDLKLKCTATLAALYWRSNEASAEPDRPHHQRSSTSAVYLDHHSALASAALSTFRLFGQYQFRSNIRAVLEQ